MPEAFRAFLNGRAISTQLGVEPATILSTLTTLETDRSKKTVLVTIQSTDYTLAGQIPASRTLWWQYFTTKRLSDNQVAFMRSNTTNILTVIYCTDSGGGAIWKAGEQY